MPIVQRNHLMLINNGAVTGAAVDWIGGPGAMYVEGTFSGATVKLQARTSQDTWVDVGASVTFTAAGVAGFDLPAGDIRAAISGGPPTNIYASVRSIPHRGG